MEILSILLVGLVAGWLASLIMKGRGLGFWGDLLIGIAGAFIGGMIFDALDIFTPGLVGSIISATIGALVLLAMISVIRRPA